MIARKSFLIVITYFITSFIGWVGLVAIAKLWGEHAPEALGIIGFAMAFLGLFNIIADIGFSRAHIKRISEGKDLGSCIGTYATIKISLVCIMVTIVFVVLFLWKSFFKGGFSDATTESVIYVFVLYYVLQNLLHIALATFEGRKEVVKRQVIIMFESVKTPLMILVAVAGIHMVGLAPAVVWPEFLEPLRHFLADHAYGSLAMTYVLSIFTSLCVGMWLLRKYPIKRPSMELFKSYFSYALPIMLFSIVGVISINIDKIMIGFFWTSVEVGYYFSIQTIITIVSVFYTAVGTVLFPTISEYHSANDFEKIKQTTHLAERYISMVIVPPIVVLLVFPSSIINIMLDSAFLPAVPILMAMTVYIFVFSLSTPYGSLINGMNRPDIAVKVGLIICISNIILNFVFIPKNGLLSAVGINGPTGAAVATALSTFIGFIGMRLAAKKFTGIKLWQTHSFLHIFAGIIMAGVLYLISYQVLFIQNFHFYHILIFAGLGLAVYLSALFLLREFKKEDLKFFLDIIHPHKMMKYVSSELKEKPPEK